MSNVGPVSVNELPKSIEEFVALRDRIADTPQGGAAVMALALLAYAEDEALGKQCLTVAADRGRLDKGPGGFKGFKLINAELQRLQTRIRGKPHMLRSYFRGTSPESGYELPAPPYVFDVSDNPYSGDIESGTYKVFLACTGASQPRPIAVKRNNRGVWNAHEWSSLTLGVVEPKQEIDDDL